MTTCLMVLPHLQPNPTHSPITTNTSAKFLFFDLYILIPSLSQCPCPMPLYGVTCKPHVIIIHSMSIDKCGTPFWNHSSTSFSVILLLPMGPVRQIQLSFLGSVGN